jgi:hypothetical protein
MINQLHGYNGKIPSEMTIGTLGLAGEMTVIRDLNRKGLAAKKASRKAGDVQVCKKTGEKLYTLEVKTARKDRDGFFQFCLYRKVGNRVCTDFRHADFVMLLAVNDDASVTAFLIPSDKLNQKKIKLSNPLNSKKYEQYRIVQ